MFVWFWVFFFKTLSPSTRGHQMRWLKEWDTLEKPERCVRWLLAWILNSLNHDEFLFLRTLWQQVRVWKLHHSGRLPNKCLARSMKHTKSKLILGHQISKQFQIMNDGSSKWCFRPFILNKLYILLLFLINRPWFNRRKILAVSTQLKQLRKKAWKKFRLERDSNPWPLRCRCRALPTEVSSQLGAGHIESSFVLSWFIMTSILLRFTGKVVCLMVSKQTKVALTQNNWLKFKFNFSTLI